MLDARDHVVLIIQETQLFLSFQNWTYCQTPPVDDVNLAFRQYVQSTCIDNKMLVNREVHLPVQVESIGICRFFIGRSVHNGDPWVRWILRENNSITCEIF